MNNRKNIVITGASGFLGRHLLERLKDDRRYSVWALTSRPEELQSRIGGTNTLYFHKDAVCGEDIQRILRDAVVVNCAYPRNSAGEDIADGLKYIQTVFEAAVNYSSATIINISSQSVYSSHRTQAASEETPVCPETPYAVGKYAVELLLESICRNTDTRPVSVRLSSLIGPGFDQRIINRLISTGMKEGRIKVNRSSRTFAFFDVEDAADNLILMISSACVPAGFYNLGSETAYSLEEMGCTVKKVFDAHRRKLDIEYTDSGETGTSSLDCTKFKAEFGSLIQRSLYESADRIYAYISGETTDGQ